MTAGRYLGAHVSAAGGVSQAPARGRAITASVIQVFTKTPNQWKEPTITGTEAAAFRAACRQHRIHAAVAHDSYLINLASPDPDLRRRSAQCFRGELERCRALGIPYVVTHPGNFIDDRDAGRRRNVAGYRDVLRAVPGGPTILIETTAGTGTALGSTFEELAALRSGVPSGLRSRIGFCADTCHLFSAGYDLRHDWDTVWREWDRIIGLRHLQCLHLNDSRTPFDSRRDRHELIGEGTLGPEPFRRIMRDPRFARIIKIIETPKRDDPVATDRWMLRRLRGYGAARQQQDVPA